MKQCGIVGSKVGKGANGFQDGSSFLRAKGTKGRIVVWELREPTDSKAAVTMWELREPREPMDPRNPRLAVSAWELIEPRVAVAVWEPIESCTKGIQQI